MYVDITNIPIIINKTMELPGFENHRAASITKFYALKKFESLFNTKIIIRKAKK